MNRSVRSRFREFWTLVGVTAVMGSVAAQAAGPSVVIELESVDALTKSAGTLMTGIGQEAPPPMIVNGAIGGILKAPGLAGIDTSKPVQLYVFLPEVKAGPDGINPLDLKPVTAFVLPTTDNGKVYAGALANTYPEATMVGAIRKMSNPAVPDQTAYLAQVGKRTALATDKTTAEMMSKILAATSGDAPALVFPGTLRLRLDIAACISYIEGVRKMTAKTMGQQQMPPNLQMKPADLIDAELEALLALMTEIRSYTLGITVSPTAINLCDRITPMSGTKTAAWMGGMSEPTDAYMKAVPEDAVFVTVGSGMDVMDQIAEPYGDLLEKIYGAMGEPMDKMGPLMGEMMMSFKDIYAGDLAFGFIPSPDGKGLGMVQLVALSDPVKAKKLIWDMYANYNETWGKAMPGLALESLPKREHNGVEIESFTYKVDETADEPVAPGMPMTPTVSLKWMNGMRWEMALIGNDLVYTLGPSAIMNGAIDRLKAGAGTAINESADFKKLFPTTSGTVVEYHSLSVCRLAKELLASIPGVPPAVVAAIPSDSPGMAGYSISKGSNLIGLDRISLAEIKAIMDAVPQMAAALPALQDQLGLTGASGQPGSAAPPMPVAPDPAMK